MTARTQASDLREFVDFARQQLLVNGLEATPEEVLDQWRAEHPDPWEVIDVLAKLRVAVVEADRGEGRPLEEFDRDFRRKHGIPGDA